MYEGEEMPPKWNREMLRTHLNEQADAYHCAYMKVAANLDKVLDIAERVGTPEFIIDLVATHTNKSMNKRPFAFDLNYCENAATNTEKKWKDIVQMKKRLQGAAQVDSSAAVGARSHG